jgi:hypothetical protein
MRDLRWDIKDTTADYLHLDVRRLRRESVLVSGKSVTITWNWADRMAAAINLRVEHDRVILSYYSRHKGQEYKLEEYPVLLDWSACHYGGCRPWFRCVGCNKRIALLYYQNGAFRCRTCCQLAYESQRETPTDRLLRRALKIRAKLNYDEELARPKGMHESTYRKLIRALDEAETEAFSSLSP